MTDTFLQGQLLQLCQHAIQTCPFTDPVAGQDCTEKFCNGFPAYIGVGTCVSLHEDPNNCCQSSDPTACLQNYAHGSSSNVCASVISILTDCFSATPTLLPPNNVQVATTGPSATALAECACYDSSGNYYPDALDGYASECAASGSAAHPTYYPLVTPLQNFCNNNAPSPVNNAVASTTAPPLITPAVGSNPSTAPAAASSQASRAPATATKGAIASSSGADAASGSGSTTSTAAAQTTTKSSGGVKNTFRNSAILLLGVAMLFNLH
ncbi:hypothetical protein BP6252_11130 [Coleophoma cylindrospora]|uniref:Uncharacterized protein n=1 Tax=Coleophoma cylindrospora TaxID=1849047 RepID=A0A3D8QP55_9HELO|nr:hypothetical protein BP6252_11130 [Coleophoma cylindrospora]